MLLSKIRSLIRNDLFKRDQTFRSAMCSVVLSGGSIAGGLCLCTVLRLLRFILEVRLMVCLVVIKTGIDDQEVSMYSQQGALRPGHDGGREEELCPVTVVVSRCNSGIICHA